MFKIYVTLLDGEQKKKAWKYYLLHTFRQDNRRSNKECILKK